VITSRDNERLKLVRKLGDSRWRDKLGLFTAEGEDLLQAAHDAGIDPVDVLVAGETVEPRLLADVASLAHPPRVVAVFRRGDLPEDLPDAQPCVALWRVADPGNVGTLVRAADALGPASLALSAGCADPTGPKALRASAGAVFRVPVVRFDDAPRPWIALAARGGDPLDAVEVTAPATFVLGAERDGVPDELLRRCDGVATIPQAAAAESLNVAMAGTIALYELARRRRPSA
jgi:RNA methyltransferase, TrmH family